MNACIKHKAYIMPIIQLLRICFILLKVKCLYFILGFLPFSRFVGLRTEAKQTVR
jgi:hypothetical protein